MKETGFSAKDNLGTFFPTRQMTGSFWIKHGIAMGTIPFVCYTFKSQTEAKQALESLSYFQKVADLEYPIALEVMSYGYFEVEGRKWEVIFWSGELTRTMINEARRSFKSLGGAEKDVRYPVTTKKKKTKALNDEVELGSFIPRGYIKKGIHTYNILSASDKETALHVLKLEKIKDDFIHCLIETSEGCFAKDKDGIYDSCLRNLGVKPYMGCEKCPDK